MALLLLRGPSTNVQPILTIVDSTPNSGSYLWDVPSTLEADTTHYGIELIVQGTGQFQYSPQCGVSNSAGGSGNSTSPTGSPSSNSTNHYTVGQNGTSTWTTTGNSSATVTGTIVAATGYPSTTTSTLTGPAASATATYSQAGPTQSISPPSSGAANVVAGVGAVALAVLAGSFLTL